MPDSITIEILAPAGGQEQLLAAVRCGASAVYLGGRGFNARRGAENFGEHELAEAVRYCHARGVRVYVTLNTLVTDAEMESMQRELDGIASSGADAVLVQDMAVAEAVRQRCPTLALHASTQMAVHNIEGMRELHRLGFSRAVLARELSLEEIKKIAAASEPECEVFVHGAHCMSVSGVCYLSSMIGGRSGNRGMCAQPCRLDFKCRGREYALSLKDMSYIGHIRELAESGVAALKIEGRMKRPEYVAAAVTACRNAAEGLPADVDALRAVFSRSGFTDGYLTGRRDRDMFGYRTKDDVEAASGVLGELAKTYKNENKLLPVDMSLSIRKDEPVRLTVTDAEHALTVEGETAQEARTVAMTAQAARSNLDKTGGTPFFLRELSADIEEGMTAPLSSLNTLRRTALERLLELRGNTAPHALRPYSPAELPEHTAPNRPALRLRFESADQLPEDTSFAERVILPADEIASDPGLVERLGGRLIAELPALIFPAESGRLRDRLAGLMAAGLTDVLCENIGAVELARELGLTPHGGAYLNILNSQALEQYRSIGLADATLSFELEMAKVRRVRGELPRGIIGYGYLPLMKLRACPAKRAEGCGDCTGRASLTDRKGESFPLVCRGRSYSELLNCLPLYVGDKGYTGTDFVTLYFTIERPEDCAHIIGLYRTGAAPDFRRTSGLYFRELL